MSSFFRVETSPAQSEAEAIELLTKLRASNYPVKLIRGIKDGQSEAIYDLVMKLSTKLLLSRMTDKNTSDTEKQSSLTQLRGVIDQLFNNNSKLAAISFAAQLLQYYTLVCHEDFEPNNSLIDFDAFLTANNQWLGDVSANLFIVEYKLVKIYNDMVTYTDAKLGKIAPIKDVDQKTGLLLDHLGKIKKQVEGWEDLAPDNAFLIYLNFFINYTYAQALECQFKIHEKKLPLDEKLSLSTIQRDVFLTACKNALTRMNVVTEFSNAYQREFPVGAEFSLGQGVLHNMPEADLDKAKEHISSLLH